MQEADCLGDDGRRKSFLASSFPAHRTALYREGGSLFPHSTPLGTKERTKVFPPSFFRAATLGLSPSRTRQEKTHSPFFSSAQMLLVFPFPFPPFSPATQGDLERIALKVPWFIQAVAVRSLASLTHPPPTSKAPLRSSTLLATKGNS